MVGIIPYYTVVYRIKHKHNKQLWNKPVVDVCTKYTDHRKTVFILGPRCKMALVILLQKQLILTFAFNVHTKNILIHSSNKKFVL